MWLDATYVKARENKRVVSKAVVVAIGVRETGEREPGTRPAGGGLDVGPSEDGAFWLGFLRGLVARGLSGVMLVTSDSHEGLKGAIGAALTGAAWRRCRVRWVRNALSLVPKAEQQLVAAVLSAAEGSGRSSPSPRPSWRGRTGGGWPTPSASATRGSRR